MRFQELRCWTRTKPQDLKKGSAVPRGALRMESGFPLRCLVPWTASIHCERCHGVMYRIQLRDWGEVEDRMVVMPCNVLPVVTSSTR